MKSRSIALLSLGVAAGLAGLVFYLQLNRLAFTSPGIDLEQYLYSEVASAQPSATEDVTAAVAESQSALSAPLELPTIVVRPDVSRRSETSSAKSLEPCSAWRDIGFHYVNEGEPSGVQRVRELC